MGPHISFAGGVAAAGYAGKRGFIETGRDIFKPLIVLKKPDVLLVGGVFGGAGYILNVVLTRLLSGKIDTVALTIWILALLARICFDNGKIFGKTPSEVLQLGGRYSERSFAVWIPWMSTSMEKMVLGIAFGVFSSAITRSLLQNSFTAPVAIFFGFSLCTASLIFMQFGAPMPVTHHIALCASFGVTVSGGSMWWGVACGVAAAFIADFLARTFLVFGDTHVDPPAMCITVISFILNGILPVTNAYKNQLPLIPIIIIAVALFYSIFQFWLLKRNDQYTWGSISSK